VEVQSALHKQVADQSRADREALNALTAEDWSNAREDMALEASQIISELKDWEHPDTCLALESLESMLFGKHGLKKLGDPQARAHAVDLSQRCLLEIEKRKLAYLRGELPTKSFDGLFAGPFNAAPTIGQLANEYLHEYQATHAQVGAKRKNMLRAIVEVIIDFFGAEMLVTHVDQRRCREFRDLLNRLPSNMRKHFPDRAMPLHDLARLAEARKLPPMKHNTQDKYVHALKQLFQWARSERHITLNPAENIVALGQKVPAKQARHSFSDGQLYKIFSAPLYQDRASENSARFWVPLIGLLSGMRLNEICQLHADDIDFGLVPCIHIRPNAARAQRVKNARSQRSVPVHPKLLELGFKQFVESRTQVAPDKQLFPEIRISKNGYRSERLSRWFNEQFLPSINAKEPRTGFHSFRHLFKQTLEGMEAPQHIIDAIGGWNTVVRGASVNYGNGPTLAHLLRYIERIDFPAIDFSELRPANHNA
jgi:integrase